MSVATEAQFDEAVALYIAMNEDVNSVEAEDAYYSALSQFGLMDSEIVDYVRYEGLLG